MLYEVKCTAEYGQRLSIARGKLNPTKGSLLEKPRAPRDVSELRTKHRASPPV